MFEWIANGFAGFTTRRPWLAVIAVLVMAVAFSAMGRPNMSNDSSEFAPEPVHRCLRAHRDTVRRRLFGHATAGRFRS